MTARGSSPSDTFVELRNQLFRSDLAALAPAERDTAGSDGLEVYGAAMEGGLARGSYLVFGLRDGSASLYLSNGGGSIGGQGHPPINAAARQFVETARAFSDTLPRATEHPIPSPGRVRFSIFTAAGVRAEDVSEAELATGQHALRPLFDAGHEIISGFRRFEEREPANESSYVNCLLTALARGTVASVTIDAAAPLPDPAQLTQDKLDADWIAEIGFDFGKLSPTDVIRLLERQAGFSALQFWKREHRFKVRLAAHGGKSFTDVTFVVGRRSRDQIEVAVERGRGADTVS
jgi:hypothetical protein